MSMNLKSKAIQLSLSNIQKFDAMNEIAPSK